MSSALSKYKFLLKFSVNHSHHCKKKKKNDIPAMLMLNRIPNPMLVTGSLGDIVSGIMTRTIGYI